jgi:hypothetical protein
MVNHAETYRLHNAPDRFPPEIWLEIASCLPSSALNRLCQVSSRLFTLIRPLLYKTVRVLSRYGDNSETTLRLIIADRVLNRSITSLALTCPRVKRQGDRFITVPASRSFMEVLIGLPRLKKLELCNSPFNTEADQKSFVDHFTRPESQLEDFSFDGRYPRWDSTPGSKFALPRLKAIAWGGTHISFGRLDRFVSQSAALYFFQDHEMDPILDSLKASQDTLQSITLSFSCYLGALDALWQFYFPRLRCLKLGHSDLCTWFTSETVDMHKCGRFVLSHNQSLEHLELHVSDSYHYPESPFTYADENGGIMPSSFPRLRHFVGRHSDFSELIDAGCEFIWTTLTRLELGTKVEHECVTRIFAPEGQCDDVPEDKRPLAALRELGFSYQITRDSEYARDNKWMRLSAIGSSAYWCGQTLETWLGGLDTHATVEELVLAFEEYSSLKTIYLEASVLGFKSPRWDEPASPPPYDEIHAYVRSLAGGLQTLEKVIINSWMKNAVVMIKRAEDDSGEETICTTIELVDSKKYP